mmetsp:Transcript_10954/g.21434  ORF Transcript_10954/g.21434 Transcript_10954/m.21434 type:complete len:251 (-) Transcript_10954:167-919(-)
MASPSPAPATVNLATALAELSDLDRRGMELAVEARTLGNTAPKTGNDMGAVVLDDNGQILVWGFARSMKHSLDRGPIDLHAETDCITQAAKRGIPLEGKLMYVTSAPCAKCLPLILGSGIRRIVHCDVLSKYISCKNEPWARNLIEEYSCELIENVEKPPYKRLNVSNRILATREPEVESRIDLSKLQPRPKKQKSKEVTLDNEEEAVENADNEDIDAKSDEGYGDYKDKNSQNGEESDDSSGSKRAKLA